jgi:hypothetical protein
MEDELTMAFQGVMKKVMRMLRVEDATTATTSSSTQGPKRPVGWQWPIYMEDIKHPTIILKSVVFHDGSI